MQSTSRLSQAKEGCITLLADTALDGGNETKARDNIEESQQFYRKYVKGTLARADLSKVDQICHTVPMPRNQVIEGVTLQKDCRHWVLAALDKLEQQGVLKASK